MEVLSPQRTVGSVIASVVASDSTNDVLEASIAAASESEASDLLSDLLIDEEVSASIDAISDAVSVAVNLRRKRSPDHMTPTDVSEAHQDFAVTQERLISAWSAVVEAEAAHSLSGRRVSLAERAV